MPQTEKEHLQQLRLLITCKFHSTRVHYTIILTESFQWYYTEHATLVWQPSYLTRQDSPPTHA
jgi:hypothetical protein